MKALGLLIVILLGFICFVVFSPSSPKPAPAAPSEPAQELPIQQEEPSPAPQATAKWADDHQQPEQPSVPPQDTAVQSRESREQEMAARAAARQQAARAEIDSKRQVFQVKIDELRSRLPAIDAQISAKKSQVDSSKQENNRLLAASQKKNKQWRYVKGGVVKSDTGWRPISELPKTSDRSGRVRYRNVVDEKAVAAYKAHNQRHEALVKEYAGLVAQKRSIDSEIQNLGLQMTSVR